MRRVVKNLAQKPASLSRPDMHDLLEAIAANKNLINSDIYRGKIRNEHKQTLREEVVEALEALYHGKCAYCEQFTETYIEHYRPKNGVNGSNPRHGGYFWLCYEWSNLVPSCHECNKVGTAKGNHFPVKHTHVTFAQCKTNGVLDFEKCNAHQSPLLDEEPYLLHPEIDEPSLYLTFKIDDFKRGIALTSEGQNQDRGRETIRICNLNRTELLRKRQEVVIDPILKGIRRAFGRLSKNSIAPSTFLEEIRDIIADQIEKTKDEKCSFTLLQKKVVEDANSFRSLLVEQLPAEQREIIQLCFEKYQSIP
ncbi:MAG: hypothetical protein MUE30_11950 [Spirosomaceae bacterium]|nr:hypothetical protein [Spirosomataceae bacterium]